jgi:hypothetical protein
MTDSDANTNATYANTASSMPANSPVNAPSDISPKTPEQIVAALNAYRNHIKLELDTYKVEQSQDALNTNTPLLGILDLVQQYVQSYVRNHHLRSTLSPSTVLRFAAKRPILVGVAVLAVVLTGPSRLVGWAAKAATILRLASVIRSGKL